MSVGVFLGIGAAFTEPATTEQVRQRVSETLAEHGLPDYRETTSLDEALAQYTALHPQARCSVDTIGSGSFRILARTIVRARAAQAGPFHDFTTAIERVFVPGEFPQRLDAPKLPGRSLWSTGALRTALRYAALTLGMPLSNNDVPPKVIQQVNAMRKLGKNDPATNEEDEHGFSMVENYRPGWLTLWEFSRLAHDNGLALVLA